MHRVYSVDIESLLACVIGSWQRKSQPFTGTKAETTTFKAIWCQYNYIIVDTCCSAAQSCSRCGTRPWADVCRGYPRTLSFWPLKHPKIKTSPPVPPLWSAKGIYKPTLENFLPKYMLASPCPAPQRHNIVKSGQSFPSVF